MKLENARHVESSTEQDVDLGEWEVDRTLWSLVTPMVWVALGLGVVVGASVGLSVGYVTGIRTQLASPAQPAELELPPATLPTPTAGADAPVDAGAKATPMEPSTAVSKTPSSTRRARTRAVQSSPQPGDAPPASPALSSTLSMKVVGASAAQAGVAADVYVDGVRVGRAPLSYHPVTSGTHRVRFDCIFEGRTHRGNDTVLDVPAETDAVVEHTCDVLVFLGAPN